jgi:hypothetical protein
LRRLEIGGSIFNHIESYWRPAPVKAKAYYNERVSCEDPDDRSLPTLAAQYTQ